MDQTTLLALQLRADNLRDDLTMLCGDLKKNGYDFTDTIWPLLRMMATFFYFFDFFRLFPKT